MANLAQPAANLAETVLAAPRMSGGYTAVRVWQGGLIDSVSAVLVLLGLLYAVVTFWRPRSMLILSTGMVVLGLAAAVQAYWVDTYRLGGAVLVLYLACAIVLELGTGVVSRAAGGSTRWAVAIVLVIAAVTTYGNVHQVVKQLTDCAALTYPYQPLSPDSDEGVLMAEKVNALGPARGTFLVSQNFQIWLYYWLYKVAPPAEYSPNSSVLSNPARWSILAYATGSAPAGPGAARFWPPAPGQGQNAITYIMPNGETAAFLPLIERAYPHGSLDIWQNSLCPAFKTTAYTLTRAQIEQAASKGRAGDL